MLLYIHAFLFKATAIVLYINSVNHWIRTADSSDKNYVYYYWCKKKKPLKQKECNYYKCDLIGRQLQWCGTTTDKLNVRMRNTQLAPGCIIIKKSKHEHTTKQAVDLGKGGDEHVIIIRGLKMNPHHEINF